MTKMKTTKSALISSILALFLCFTMLLGTTFAWFTDSVTSANNIIQSGTLDILLEYYDVEDAEWKDVNDSTDILTGDLWEPGYTDVAYLRIKNNGSLALKYALSVNVVSEKEGTNKAGETFKLSDYIYFDVVEGKEPVFADRVEAMAAVDSETKISKGYAQSASLGANSEFVYLAMVVFMPTDVGNEANHNGENIPEIDLGINIFATQDTVESDSFGTDYDADNAVGSVAEANAMLAENKDVTLMGCDEADGIIVVPADYTGTLTLVNSSIKSVQAEKNVNIVILGNVVVDANGSGVATVADGETAAAFNGSAISADGELNISGSGTLTAIAADTNGAFGIGGMKTQVINIEGVTIERAEGAYAYEIGSDTKYYKDAPEGGAAIGSGYDGAVITLDGVTVINAIGGSKAAGIGARYHVGVTVNITDSAIAYVEGGASAAGIGGSRVSGDLTESGTTINISNSTITAKGGVYGAGIGSGYDTHCASNQPMCTINITGSMINAEGGQYAAGVGTGYHNAALDGEIKNSTVNAESGEKFYKDSYTLAMDIGFGVTDPAREGQQIDSKLIYNGEEIRLPSCAVVSNATEFATALAEGKDVVLTEDIVLSEALTITQHAVIQLNGKTLTSSGLDFQAGATIQNGTIASGGNTNMTPHIKVSGGELKMDTVTVDVKHHLNANVYWAEATGMEIQNATATLNNCNIKIDNPTGAQWVYSYGISLNNATVTMNGGSITALCEEGTAANGPTNPNAICSMGDCTMTLNNVTVDATYYAATVNGHLTINTTDKKVTSTIIVDNRGGSHTLNYID